MLQPRSRFVPPSAPVRRAKPTAKLDDQKVREIRRLDALGVNIAALAVAYDVSETTIRKVADHASWQDVPREPLPERRAPAYRPANAKLTPEDRKRIRWLLLEGTRTLKSIADEFGVSSTRIGQIRDELGHRLRTKADWR
jgi:transposase-like protein